MLGILGSLGALATRPLDHVDWVMVPKLDCVGIVESGGQMKRATWLWFYSCEESQSPKPRPKL